MNPTSADSIAYDSSVAISDTPIRRPVRWTIKLRLGLWLLLVAAVGVAAVRSLHNCDVVIEPTKPGDQLCVVSEFGVLVIEWHGLQSQGPDVGQAEPTWVYVTTPLPRRWPMGSRFLGFETYRSTIKHYFLLKPTPLDGITIPFWLILMIPAFGATRLWLRYYTPSLADRRRKKGCCECCGYDLRATPGVCPECGTSPAIASA